MAGPSVGNTTSGAHGCLAGGGAMGALMRSMDWSKTPLGPVESWPPALKVMAGFLLANRSPMLLCWGSGFCQLYNDAFLPCLGTKHPQSLGQPASECWPEAWPIIGPVIETAYQVAEPGFIADLLLEVPRRGGSEETHWTFACAPIADDASPDRTGGVAASAHEITGAVLSERRMALLSKLRGLTGAAATTGEACALVSETLGGYPKDIPFALLYLMDESGASAQLAGAAGVRPGEPASPFALDLRNPASEVPWQFPNASPVRIVGDLSRKLPRTPPGPWADPPRSAALLPLSPGAAHPPAGFLVLGISSRLAFDRSYQAFYELIAGQIAEVIAQVRRPVLELPTHLFHAARVLIVTAGAELRGELESGLSGEYVTHTAAGSVDALAALRDHAPDLVVSDQVLPDTPDARRVPVLLITSHDGSSVSPETLAAGSGDYLARPFSAPALRVRVQNLIAIKRARDLLRSELDSESQDLPQLTAQLASHRRQLQSSLMSQRESEARWRGVFEHSAAGMALTDLTGRFQAVNPAHRKFLGYSEEELRRMSFLDVTHEDDRAAVSAMFAELVEGRRESFQTEKRYRRKDGRLAWASVHISLVADGDSRPQLALAVIEDITGRKRTEAAYLQLAAVVESSDDAIIGRSFDGVITSWNRGAERMYGYSAMEVIGTYQPLHFPSRRPEELEDILSRVPRGEGLEHYETRHVRKDGVEIDVSLTVSAMKNSAGAVVGACAISRDITSRKKAAEDLQAAQTQLAKMSRATVMGELAASIAHEINQPLSAVLANGNACLRWLNRPQPDLEEVRAACEAMVKQGERAAEVIRKIRSLLRNRPPQLSPVDMNELVNEVLVLTRDEIQRHNISLHTDLAPGLPVIQGDSIQLQQVLVNLIFNAIDAMRGAGAEQSGLYVTTRGERQDRITVAVCDSGVGIDTKNMDQLFMPFFTTKATGMGMGLSISRSIVEAHGGRLWATSNDAAGATFHFSLPAAGRID